MRIGRMMAVAAVASVGTAWGRECTSLAGEGWTFDGEPVSIPHTWNALDGCDGLGEEHDDSASATSYARRAGRYRRALPNVPAGSRAFLRFNAVSTRARVFVNGCEVGSHDGAYTAFELEITRALRPSGNILEVVVDNCLSGDLTDVPISADYTVYGGIYRDVQLVTTDAARFDTSFDGGPGVWVTPDATTGDVQVETRLDGATTNALVSFEIRTPEGARVATSETPRLTIDSPRLWSPETPNLYTLVARLADGASTDEVRVNFGFRTAEVRADGFYLNGKRRFLHGVNRHQDREGKGWAISAADMAEDVALMKRMGADAVRTAHYPHAGAFYSLCDSEGLLAWVEYPNVDAVNDAADYIARSSRNVREMISQLRNHPSIFVWGLANEIDARFMSRVGLMQVRPARVMAPIVALARAWDPTRPTAIVSCDRKPAEVNGVADLLGFNLYPGWYVTDVDGMPAELDRVLAANPGRTPVVVTEYGAGGSITQHDDAKTRNGTRAPIHTEEYQAYVHQGNYRGLASDRRLWGAFVWAMFDFGADARREGPRFGLNDKGLVTFDHKTPKDAFYFYKANWNPAPELHLVGGRMTTTTNACATVMGFSNVGDVRLTVNGRAIGTKSPDAVKTVIWEKIPLAPGVNEIRLEASGCASVARWLLQP